MEQFKTMTVSHSKFIQEVESIIKRFLDDGTKISPGERITLKDKETGETKIVFERDGKLHRRCSFEELTKTLLTFSSAERLANLVGGPDATPEKKRQLKEMFEEIGRSGLA